MGASKHTPGPWLLGDLDDNGQRLVRSQHIEICTCWHHSVASLEQEMEANSRLIAAAPDLLRAACEILRTGLDEEARHGDQREAIMLLVAAVAEAVA